MRVISKFWLFCLVILMAPAALAGVGFFAPDGLPKSVIRHTQIGLISAHSAETLEKNLSLMRGSGFKAYVDLGSMIERPRDASTLSMQYRVYGGSAYTKRFKPQSPNYLRIFPSDEHLRRILEPIADVMARHKTSIGAVFIADEPYVHGISKTDMERAGRIVRGVLNKHGLVSVKIGVIFASGMFNSDFAHQIDYEAGKYAQRIDHYYDIQGGGLSSAAFATWVKAIEEHRLVTYDGAGNMYVDGGLPRGFDIYGFDFYLSTLLLDGTHENTLSWLANRYPDVAGCKRFAGTPVSRVREQLSFFKDGKVLTGAKYQSTDRDILDAAFSCRMGAVTDMLLKMGSGLSADFLFVTESSDNGVLEFSKTAVAKPEQPEAIVTARVLDEVKRAEQFYEANYCVYKAGLLFFTYQDTYDAGIRLHIGGASSMPTVMSSIYTFAEKIKAANSQTTCPAG